MHYCKGESQHFLLCRSAITPFLHNNQDLDVVELLSGVESIAFVARVARVAGHQGHQHLQAERFDKHRLLGITDRKGQGCKYITCVEGFRNALQLFYW